MLPTAPVANAAAQNVLGSLLPFTDTRAVRISKNKRVKDPVEKSIDCAKFPTGFLGRSVLTLRVKEIFTHTGDR
jgi:hypothetical protein